MRKTLFYIIFLAAIMNMYAQQIIIEEGATITVENGSDICAGAEGNIIGELLGGTQCNFVPQTIFAGGEGTSNDPFLISNADQLDSIRYFMTSYFKLIRDIDLNEEPYNSGEGWKPIGTNKGAKWFRGYLDGNGKTIKNLFINRGSLDFVGLFGSIFDGEIKNLALENVNVTGRDYTGSLVGLNYSDITECYSTGSVKGSKFVGGLSGANESYQSSSGDIINSYSRASVNSRIGGGGLVGRLISGNIEKSYSTGPVNNSGGLIGVIVTGNVNNCFWDMETSEKLTSPAGKGLSTNDMKLVSTFTNAGWDFKDESANGSNDVWTIDHSKSKINSGYPYLSWQNIRDVEIGKEVLSLNIVKTGSGVQINWQNNRELDLVGFDLQRMYNYDKPLIVNKSSASTGYDAEWESIGFVRADRQPHNLEGYSFTDLSPFKNAYQETELNYRLKKIYSDGTFEFTETVQVTSEESPAEFKLEQNYPNPFNPATTISYSISEPSKVKLIVYDTLGREVAELVNSVKEQGVYNVKFDAEKLSSGLYIYTLSSGEYKISKKLMLLK